MGGALFVALAAATLVLDDEQRNIVLQRFAIRRRRDSGSLTPPRSLSLDKQSLSTNKPSPEPDYSNNFPPSRREALAELPPDAIKRPGKSATQLSQLPPDFTKRLPSEEVWDAEKFADHVSPTGFSLEEIKRLGDFPDYATLSGVPLPREYEGFDIATAKARPYRPLRWAYHQTMSLSKLENDWWLELKGTYVERIKQRQELYRKHGSEVLQQREVATKELMEMWLEFYCARYPQYFRIDKTAMVFHNSLLNTITDVKTTAPLHALLNNVAEDFTVMVRHPDTGFYSFRSGVAFSTLGWSVGRKIGLKLHEIHAPIPDYKDKMQLSMDRFPSKLPTDKPIQRGSWGLEIDKPLFMPPGDPHEKLRDAQDPSHTLDRCHWRVDWQTVRRLPLSGAVVFNFKAVFTPVEEFRDEPYVPSLMLKVLHEGKRSLLEYTSTWHTEHLVIPAMEMFEREQKDKGLVEKDWEPRTLDEAPFYPGWEEKWHRQQGF